MFSNSVPVVGKILGDSIDTILGSTLILKNAIGVLGVIILLGIVLTPILKIIILLSVYGISSALIQPFAEKRVTQCIDDTVGTGKVVLGIVATVTVIFIIGIVAMLKMSNTIAMLR
jgi:stage III sporulation protein AE